MITTHNVHDVASNDVVADLLFCGTAARLDADKVGWLPHQAYREAFLSQRLVIVENNNDRVGFALWQLSRGQLKLYQVWVRQDARLILHGRALVDHVERFAIELGAYRLRAWVAEDLAANTFWKAIGFEHISWRYSPRKHSSRRHLLWVRTTASQHVSSQCEPSLQHGESLLLPTRTCQDLQGTKAAHTEWTEHQATTTQQTHRPQQAH